MEPPAQNQHSALDELRALEEWAFGHPDHLCNGLCPDEDPPSEHSPGMASRDPGCEWCQRIDLFHGLFEQLEIVRRERDGLREAAVVVVDEFHADNPFVGYAVEELARRLGEDGPFRGAPVQAARPSDE